MFIAGFFAGLLFLLIFDLIAGAYIKYRINKDYAEELD
jgi:hypothetical protein